MYCVTFSDTKKYKKSSGHTIKLEYFRGMKQTELIITRDEIEGDVRYNVMDLIDPSFSGRGESFRSLREATSYCKKHKVGYARNKSIDIIDN
jgi:hypothetical protein